MKSPDQNKFDVIVIGGGAAGLIAAGRAAFRGKRVLLIEKNKKLGEKLSITGGGRCNITNAEFDERVLLKKYGESEQFLYSPFSKFGVKNTFTFFESLGLPIVVQGDKRAFPKTEKATDVCTVLEKYVRDSGVEIKTNLSVTKIVKKENKIELVIVGGISYFADNFILATGGMSHPETGSTGDGFSWLIDLGHSVRKPTPGIVPLRVDDDWVKRLAGVSISGVKITFLLDQIKKFAKTGKVLFTHFGISGPLILNNAHLVSDMLHSGNVTASIDLFPKDDHGALDRRLLALFDSNKNKLFKNVVKDIVPASAIGDTILVFLSEDITIDTKVHSVTKEQRKKIVEVLKSLPLTVTGLMGYDRAVVADGGVALFEIDTKTMRSEKISNLYIVGDLLDINRPSGGYSLQLCWTTGYVAGDSV